MNSKLVFMKGNMNVATVVVHPPTVKKPIVTKNKNKNQLPKPISTIDKKAI